VAHTKFGVEVLTPEGEVFNDEVEMVSTRTVIGSIGILANHEPLLAMLDPTELRLYRSDTEIVHLAQGEGYLQMIDNHALILGVWATMTISMWGSGFELVVDPYRLKKQGMIELTTFMLTDVTLKYPQGFVIAQCQK